MKFRSLLFSLALLLIPSFTYGASVSPSTLELEGMRGNTVSATFTVINTSASDKIFYLNTLPFSSQGESGTPQFFPKTDSEGLTKWIIFPVDHITVPKNAKLDVPFQISVPNDVPSGEHHAAITVSSAPSEIVATNGAIIEAKTAILVFLIIKGETVQKASIVDFVSMSGENLHSVLVEDFALRVQNQGNVSVVPKGMIEIRDVFGRVILSETINPTEGKILPLSTRKFETQVGHHPKDLWSTIGQQMSTLALGPMTATATVYFTDSPTEKPQTASTSFIYMPYHIIVLDLISLLLILFVYATVAKKFSKNNSSK